MTQSEEDWPGPAEAIPRKGLRAGAAPIQAHIPPRTAKLRLLAHRTGRIRSRVGDPDPGVRQGVRDRAGLARCED